MLFSVQGNNPDELYKVALPAIPHHVCQRNSRMRIAQGILCAGDFTQGGASTCQVCYMDTILILHKKNNWVDIINSFLSHKVLFLRLHKKYLRNILTDLSKTSSCIL